LSPEMSGGSWRQRVKEAVTLGHCIVCKLAAMSPILPGKASMSLANTSHLPRWGRWQARPRLTEGCPPLDSATPLRQPCGLPPPLAGEELRRVCKRYNRLTLRLGEQVRDAPGAAAVAERVVGARHRGVGGFVVDQADSFGD